MEADPLSERQNAAPIVFVSYSHDSKEHKAWVAAFSNRLLENGVQILLDQFDTELGDDIGLFINHAFKTADRVLMICTETYVRKADDGHGGAGYEAMIVTANLVKNLGMNRFIPVIRQSGADVALPICVGSKRYVNLSDGPDFESNFEELLKAIHKVRTVPKSSLGANPFAEKSFKGDEAVAKREDRRIQFADILSNSESVFYHALDAATENQTQTWLRLVRAARERGVTELQEIAKEINQAGLLTSAQLTPENVIKMGLRCVTSYSAYTACLLAGVVSENARFANQLSWTDSILDQTEWPKQGLVYWVEMPELIFFAVQALVGGSLMHTGNVEIAFKLSTTRVKTVRDIEADAIFKQATLIGWPNSLGHNCSTSFKFLDSVFENWGWLSQPFGSSVEVRTGVNAYYLLMGFLDFISLLKSGVDFNQQLIVTVPLNFSFSPKEAQRAGYRLFLSNRHFLKELLVKNNISAADVETNWLAWMRQTAALLGPWGFRYAPENAKFPKDLFTDPSVL